MRAPGIDDLFPDGLPIDVAWDTWRVGQSIFVPCLNTKKAVVQARAVARRKQYTLESQVRIENGYLGVRIWRTT
jgi:hypothetical protein